MRRLLTDYEPPEMESQWENGVEEGADGGLAGTGNSGGGREGGLPVEEGRGGARGKEMGQGGGGESGEGSRSLRGKVEEGRAGKEGLDPPGKRKMLAPPPHPSRVRGRGGNGSYASAVSSPPNFTLKTTLAEGVHGVLRAPDHKSCFEKWSTMIARLQALKAHDMHHARYFAQRVCHNTPSSCCTLCHLSVL